MAVAIIGMGVRFPGEASTPENFWEMLLKARSAQSDVPMSRYNADAFHHSHPGRLGSTTARKAHFMNQDPYAFDAPFFSMKPKEAKEIDPQQRMLLEVSYQAFENAGIAIDSVKGSLTSCYVGGFGGDYRDLLIHDNEGLGQYAGAGLSSALQSNRISWFFDMKGPSMTLDTACSSSLISLHLACQSLLHGEAEMAIAAGTNLMLGPDLPVLLSSGGLLSCDGKSQAFDHKANGFARGEGMGVLILKKVEHAIHDGDTIRAVIRGTACNHDGRTPAVSHPSSAGQAALIRTAYRAAGISPLETGYFEAHGTGTETGDPLEIGAIIDVFAPGRKSDLIVGSVKTNIGHLEGSSGIAGVIKAALVVERGIIPPNLWFEKLNPRITLPPTIKIATRLTPWYNSGARVASVNSFGFGGANGHCIVTDAHHYLASNNLSGNHYTELHPHLTDSTPYSNGVNGHEVNGNGVNGNGVNGHKLNGHSTEVTGNGLSGNHYTELTPHLLVSTPNSNGVSDYKANGNSIVNGNGVNGHSTETTRNGTEAPPIAKPKLVVFSAQDRQGPARVAERLGIYLDSHADKSSPTFLRDLTYTLADRRGKLPWKSFVFTCDANTLREALNNVPAAVRSSRAPRLAFVFTGQGAQWYAMGRELFAYPVFRSSLEACQYVLRSLGCTWHLHEELHRSEADSRLDAAEHAQVVCAALQIGLVDLLRDWGVQPSAVVGHSSGEIAAAYAAGAVSRRVAMALAWYRGLFATKVESNRDLAGGMLAVRASGEQILPLLRILRTGKSVVACYNSPKNCTVSGGRKALEELQPILESKNIGFTMLKVKVAYHSSDMQTVAPDYLSAISAFLANSNDDASTDLLEPVPFFSALRGKFVNPKLLGAKYWVENLVSPVDFTSAVQAMLQHSQGKSAHEISDPFVDALVEVGPHSALRTYVLEICAAEDEPVSIPYITSLRRKFNALQTMFTAAGELWCLGSPLHVNRINETSPTAKMLINLPPYPFNHSTTYTAESVVTYKHRTRQFPRHDLLGYPVSGAMFPQWRNFFRLQESPWMLDHKVQSSIVYPGAGLMVMAIEAMRQLADSTDEVTGIELRDVNISAALRVPDDERGIEVMTSIDKLNESAKDTGSPWSRFTVASRSGSKESTSFQTHCEGLIRLHYKSQSNAAMDDEVAQERQALAEAYSKTEQVCTTKDTTFYDVTASLGLEFGPTFRNLTEIHAGGHTGCALITVPDTKAVMPSNFEFPSLIHPTTLDAVVQMLYPAINDPAIGLTAALVPVYVQSLHISTSIPSAPGTQFKTFSAATRQSSDTWNVSICAFDNDMSPVVIAKGLEAASLGGGGGDHSRQTQSDSDSFCFQTVWQEDIDFLRPEQAQDLIYARVSPDTDDEPHYEMLCLVCYKYLGDMLEWFSGEGRKHVPKEGILKLYYEWIVNQCRERPELFADRSELAAKVKKGSQTIRSTEAGAVTLELIDRIGTHLQDFFRSAVEPLQVMLEGGLLYDFYRAGLGTIFNDNVAEYMAMLCHKHVGQMSVLEVGAGTGGTTRRILNRVRQADGSSMIKKYVFTDISAGFLGNASEGFPNDRAIMEFKTLDIENDPANQGFIPGSFDVLVCANVLHATTTITETLKYCRSLLKKGGKLVLVEMVESVVVSGFIMGSLPGWWLGEDDGRKGGPLLTAPMWDDRLRKSGFSGLDLNVAVQNEGLIKNPVALLVSTRLDDDNDSINGIGLTESRPAINILVDETSISAKSCANILQSLIKTNQQSVSVLPWNSVSLLEIQGSYCICLLELEKPFLTEISEIDFNKFKDVLYSTRAVCWITRGASVESSNPLSSLMAGVARTVMNENENADIMLLDLDSTVSSEEIESLGLASNIISSHIAGSISEKEFAIRKGITQVPRVLKLPEFNDVIRRQDGQGPASEVAYGSITGPVKMVVQQPGLLDSMCLEKDEAAYTPLPADHVEIEVKAAGLNFKDVLVAMGKVKDSGLGLEGSGVVTRIGSDVTNLKVGDRIFGFAKDCFAKYARFPAEATLKLPEDMSFENAASLMVIYATVYYSFFEVGRLQPGESVLIHSAAGGVGQAAIILAKYIGAEIYCTVGSEKKRALLIGEYEIPDDHIFSSRGHSFAKGVMRMTNNHGVDAVLNSLAGESLSFSWQCLSEFGRFLEIGRVDLAANNGLEMRPFLQNRTFSGVNLSDFINKPIKPARKIFAGLRKLLEAGVVKTVKPVTVYEIGEIEKAFRLMQTGEHMGKVVIRMSHDSRVRYLPPPPSMPIDSEGTYILAGGMGGLGRAMAEWLISVGAKNLVFLSRSAQSNEDNRKYLQQLRNNSKVRIEAWDCDVTDKTALEGVLSTVKATNPPIKGAIMCAIVWRDAVFERMTLEEWFGCVKPKVHGSQNLHELLPSDLDFFIVMSSALGIIGYRGNANYQASNIYQDALAHHRRSQGLAALTIDLGAVTGVGVLAVDSTDTVLQHLRIAGARESSLNNITAVIAAGCGTNPPSHPANIIMGLPTNYPQGGEPYYWMHPPTFNALRNEKSAIGNGASGSGSGNARPPLKEEVAQAAGIPAAAHIIAARLSEWLTRLMVIPVEDIDAQKPLTAYGVDSLVAVELRTWIIRETGQDLSVFDIMRNVPTSQLCFEIATAIKGKKREE